MSKPNKVRVNVEPAGRKNVSFFQSVYDTPEKQQEVYRFLSQNRDLMFKYMPQMYDDEWQAGKHLIEDNSLDVDGDGINDHVIYRHKRNNDGKFEFDKDGNPVKGSIVAFNGYQVKPSTFKADIKLPEIETDYKRRQKLNYRTENIYNGMLNKIKDEPKNYDTYGNFTDDAAKHIKEIHDMFEKQFPQNDYPHLKKIKNPTNMGVKRFFDAYIIKPLWDGNVTDESGNSIKAIKDNAPADSKLKYYQELSTNAFCEFVYNYVDIHGVSQEEAHRLLRLKAVTAEDSSAEDRKLKGRITRAFNKNRDALKKLIFDNKSAIMKEVYDTEMNNRKLYHQ